MHRKKEMIDKELGALLLALVLGGCVKAPGAKGASAPTMPDGELYCVGWTQRNMRPWCIEPVTAEQASHMGAYVWMRVKDGRAVRVEYKNGAGGRRTDPSGDAGYNVEYDAGGCSLRWFDRWEKPTTITRYEGNTVKFYKHWGKPKRERPEDAYMRRITLDAQGFTSATKAVDEAGNPATIDGIHETRFVQNGLGQATERSFFDEKGAPATDQTGMHRVRERIGKLGCVEQWEHFDAAGKPFGGAQMVVRGVRRCDSHGNMLSMRWYDAAGAPALNRQGIHGWDSTLDEHGQRVLHVTIGLDGRPAPVNGRESTLRERYNAYGHVVRVDYLGANQEPFTLPEGYAAIRYDVHENGAILRQTYLDSNGSPVTSDNHASWTAEYNSEGRRVTVKYYDPQGKPAQARAGHAVETYRYDDRGLLASVTYRDPSGRPMNAFYGYAEVIYKHDDEGRLSGREHRDASGALARVVSGRSMWFSYIGSESSKPAAIPKEEAQRRAEEAIRRLRAGASWVSVGKQFGEYADATPTVAGPEFWYEPLWRFLSQSKPGDPPVLLDTPRGFAVVERKD